MELLSIVTDTGTGWVVAMEATAAATIAEDDDPSPAAGERPSSQDSTFLVSAEAEEELFLGLVEDVMLCIFLICTLR